MLIKVIHTTPCFEKVKWITLAKIVRYVNSIKVIHRKAIHAKKPVGSFTTKRRSPLAYTLAYLDDFKRLEWLTGAYSFLLIYKCDIGHSLVLII